jgi:hypothetical protein
VRRLEPALIGGDNAAVRADVQRISNVGRLRPSAAVFADAYFAPSACASKRFALPVPPALQPTPLRVAELLPGVKAWVAGALAGTRLWIFEPYRKPINLEPDSQNGHHLPALRAGPRKLRFEHYGKLDSTGLKKVRRPNTTTARAGTNNIALALFTFNSPGSYGATANGSATQPARRPSNMTTRLYPRL